MIVIAGCGVVLLKILREYQLTSRLMLLMTLMICLHNRRLGGLLVLLSLRPVIARFFFTALAHLSKAAPTLRSESAKFVAGLVAEEKDSRVATVKAETEVDRQKWWVYIAQISTNNDLNDDSSLCGPVTNADRHEAELLSDTSVTSAETPVATAEFRETHDIISVQSKQLVKVMPVKMSTSILEDNVALYGGSDEGLLMDIKKVTAESTKIGK